MSIERKYSRLTGHTVAIACDICGDEAEDAPEFGEALDLFKEAGGRVKKVGGEWEHHCNDCKGY